MKNFIKKGDEIIISEMEHHSNIVPWQMICEENGIILKTINVFENGEIDLDNFKEITQFMQGDKFTLIASPNK